MGRVLICDNRKPINHRSRFDTESFVYLFLGVVYKFMDVPEVPGGPDP